MSQERSPGSVAAFTVVELLAVIAIGVLMIGLLIPAFNAIRGGADVTTAADTVKGALEQTRTYAIANNTYAWVGFSGSIGANVSGQVAIAAVASNDGTNSVCAPAANSATRLSTDSTTVSPMVVGSGLGTVSQIGKLTRLDNSHVGDGGNPNDGTAFGTRPNLASTSRIATAADSVHSFTVQQTLFKRWVQFSPRGEPLLNGGGAQITEYTEVGILPARGGTLSANPNVVALQISGLAGNIRIYRR